MQDLINALLNEAYVVNNKSVQGQAFSYLHTEVRMNYRGLSNAVKFENLLISMGYTVAQGKNHRNQNCMVVYL